MPVSSVRRSSRHFLLRWQAVSCLAQMSYQTLKKAEEMPHQQMHTYFRCDTTN